MKKALSERLLVAELDEHLVGEAGRGVGNHRDGASETKMLTGTSKVTLDIPRDGSFNSKLMAKYQLRFPIFDDKLIFMYARGMPGVSFHSLPQHWSDGGSIPVFAARPTSVRSRLGAGFHTHLTSTPNCGILPIAPSTFCARVTPRRERSTSGGGMSGRQAESLPAITSATFIR